jgi:hypothetical protein
MMGKPDTPPARAESTPLSNDAVSLLLTCAATSTSALPTIRISGVSVLGSARPEEHVANSDKAAPTRVQRLARAGYARYSPRIPIDAELVQDCDA